MRLRDEAPFVAAHVPSPLWGNPSFDMVSIKGVVAMSFGKSRKLALVLTVAGTFAAGSAAAQTATSGDTGRKVKSKVTPVYPELARRLSVYGRVKLELVITPDGRVKSTRVVGGHPILVQACQDAVKDWKFVSASEETMQMVECDFRDQQQ